MDGDGRWIILVGMLSAFVKTAQVPNCPPLRAEPYASVAHTSVRPIEAKEFCFVGWPLLWQGCAIMWPCTCKGER